MFVIKYKDNLLKDHPDGLGKHIEVQKTQYVLTEQDVKEYFMLGCVPFYFRYREETYVVIVGSDLILDNIDETRPPTIEEANIILHKMDYWLKQMYTYLNIPEKEIQFFVIGAK